LLNLITFSSF